MGLFSRKKKIRVPIPPSEDLLKFPKPSRIKEEVIQPEKIKEAVGLEKATPPPEPTPLPELLPEIPPKMPEFPEEKPFSPPSTPSLPRMPPHFARPFFLRIQHYQKLLESLDSFKNNTKSLDLINKNLEKSEFNENKDYERLKSDLKKIHSRLLFLDDLIFKK